MKVQDSGKWAASSSFTRSYEHEWFCKIATRRDRVLIVGIHFNIEKEFSEIFGSRIHI